MLRTHKRDVWAMGLVLSALPWAVGCERVSSSSTTAGTSEIANAASTIDIDGSSTTVLLTEAVAHEFRAIDPDAAVSISVSGTGGGFKRFCVGETDISNASRPIKASELEIAKQSGVEFIELPVALDGISIAVHKNNTWVDSLTIEELRSIFRASNPARKWSEVREGWPNRPISMWAPGTSSGTFDYFQEVVFPDKANMRLADISMSEDDHILVRGIAGDLDSLGFVGFAYCEANKDRVRCVPIADGGPAVMPTAETIRDGTYRPLGRPLFIYVNTRSLDEPQVRRFVDYYLESAATLAEAVGYVSAPDRIYSLGRVMVQTPMTGTRWLDANGEHIHASLAHVYPPDLEQERIASSTCATAAPTPEAPAP